MNDKETKVGMEENFRKEGSGQQKENGFQGKKGKGKRRKYSGSGRRGSGRNGSGVNFNDVAYYMRNPKIAEAFGKLPFNYIVGNKPGNFSGYATLPAISSYGVDWTINPVNIDGSDTSVKDILNEVATIIYGTMRRHNSGSTNGIEHVDVIVSNLIAGIDILANAVYAGRLFKIANTYSWRNRLIPRVLFKHLGIDYDDFIANQANYRGRLNTLLAEAKTIKVLHNYPFVDAILSEYSKVFKDSETDTGREQIMISAKYFHHIYDPVGTQTNPGGSVRLLKLKDMWPTASADNHIVLTAPVFKPNTRGTTGASSGPGYLHKFSLLLDIMNVQIQALVTDSDFNLIQADLEKAFGETGNYLTVDSITSDETFQPEYSGEFWDMVHNGRFIPMDLIKNCPIGKSSADQISYKWASGSFNNMLYTVPNYFANSVYQVHDEDTGRVKLAAWMHICVPAQQIIDDTSLVGTSFRGILDSQKDDPSVEDVFIMTRFKSFYSSKANKTRMVDAGCPPELLPNDSQFDTHHVLVPEAQSNFIVFGGLTTSVEFQTNSNVGYEWWSDWDNLRVIGVANTDFGLTRAPFALMGYEHRPLQAYETVHATGTMPPQQILLNEINNIRNLTSEELYNIHNTAFLSLWSLPELTTF